METISFLDMLVHYSNKLQEISENLEDEKNHLNYIRNLAADEMKGEYTNAVVSVITEILQKTDDILLSSDEVQLILCRIRNEVSGL